MIRYNRYAQHIFKYDDIIIINIAELENG